MNIAIIIPTLTTGGAERAAVILGNYFVDKGHNVYYFLFANKGRIFFDVKGTIVNTHVVYPFSQNLGEKGNLRELFFTARSFRKIKKKYDIDVSISFMEGANFVNICSRANDRVVVSVRTVLSERHEFSGILYDPKWIKRMYRRADKVVSVSDYVGEDLRTHYGIQGSLLTTVPNVSLLHMPLRDEEIWEYGDRVIVCTGRMDPVKQQDRIIRAFRHTHDCFRDAKLIIIGDGKQKDYLQALCHELELEDSIFFAGASNDVGFFLSHARAFVMASRVEGFPNAMVEAMAYGVPVITTDSPGGCGEIVGRVNSVEDIQYCEHGIVTPHLYGECPRSLPLERGEVLLGDAMLKILTDDELYMCYSEKSRKRSEYYHIDNVMSMWGEVMGVKR